MARLHGGRRDKLEISPNLWAGVGLVRGGAGTALVGDPVQVADRMKEYMSLGIDRFILSGYPHLEECYRFAELVFPLLPVDSVSDRAPHRRAKCRSVRRDGGERRLAAANQRSRRLRIPSMPSGRFRVAIIGGGLAGASAALHLMRDHAGVDATVDLVEPRAILGAGLAYSTNEPQARINVAAARMSLFDEDPAHFDRWFRDLGGTVDDPAAALRDGRLYPRRREFGRYVDMVVRGQAAALGADRLCHRQTRAVVVSPRATGWSITLASGQSLSADAVIVAVGHPPPTPPRALQDLSDDDPGFIVDPWDEELVHNVPRTARVLVVGTGLTMADIVASLRHRGHFGPVTAVSRRGLLSRPRTKRIVVHYGDFTTEPARQARDLVLRVRQAIAELSGQDRPWEDVIDSVRHQGRSIWLALPPPERHRLLRHLRPFWDVHRFQCSPQIDAIIRRELRSGGLTVIAGSLQSATRDRSGFRVSFHPRGSAAETVAEGRFDVIINCTGPAYSSLIETNPPLAALARAGRVRADEFTASELRLIDRAGRSIIPGGRARICSSSARWPAAPMVS